MLTAGIDQHQIAVAQPLVVVAVVEDARVCPTADDRWVGAIGAVPAKLVHQLGHQFVFIQTGLAMAHCPDMRLAGNLPGALHELQFGWAFEQPHVMQHMVKCHKLVGLVSSDLGLGAQRIDPADHPLVELLVHAHRVIDPGAPLQQARQDLIDVRDRKGIIGAIGVDSPRRTRAPTVP